MYDLIIIGAGVTGAAVAMEASRYRWKTAVLEREEDVCCGTSKANSGIVHAGFDAAFGSKKAQYNVRGSRMMESLCRNLDIPYRRCGALVVCTEEERLGNLERLLERGMANGVEHLEIITDKEKIFEIEPNLSRDTAGILYAPDSAIVCPFELNLAMAETAASNGTEFHFETQVREIGRCREGYWIETSRGRFETRFVVNAAGVYGDVFHNMVSSRKLGITPRRGEYILLDKAAGNHVTHTIFALPGKMGKGVLVTPTVHGNLIVGPTAEDIGDKEGTQTTREGLETVIRKSAETVWGLPLRQAITSFAGLRAHENGDDFVIGEAKGAPGFVDCIGIESPGLTSAPAIGEAVAEWFAEKLGLEEKKDYIRKRQGIPHLVSLSTEEQAKLIRRNPAFGRIVCRCELVTEGEILEAIRRPLGARSLDGIKRRTRAGMGRCQGGFCSPKIMELLSAELGIPMEQITKSGGASRMMVAKTKEFQPL